MPRGIGTYGRQRGRPKKKKKSTKKKKPSSARLIPKKLNYSFFQPARWVAPASTGNLMGV